MKILKSNAGANAVNIVMWIGAILAVLIMVAWFIKTFRPYNVDLDVVDKDIGVLFDYFSGACNSHYFKARFNPVLQQGYISINNTQICEGIYIYNKCRDGKNGCNSSVLFQRCRVLICNTSNHYFANLTNITYFWMEKNDTFRFWTE